MATALTVSTVQQHHSNKLLSTNRQPRKADIVISGLTRCTSSNWQKVTRAKTWPTSTCNIKNSIIVLKYGCKARYCKTIYFSRIARLYSVNMESTLVLCTKKTKDQLQQTNICELAKGNRVSEGCGAKSKIMIHCPSNYWAQYIMLIVYRNIDKIICS